MTYVYWFERVVTGNWSNNTSCLSFYFEYHENWKTCIMCIDIENTTTTSNARRMCNGREYKLKLVVLLNPYSISFGIQSIDRWLGYKQRQRFGIYVWRGFFFQWANWRLGCEQSTPYGRCVSRCLLFQPVNRGLMHWKRWYYRMDAPIYLWF